MPVSVLIAPAAAGKTTAIGAAALVAQHLTVRPTQDLDFFTDVAEAR
jgi:hypothetical protein